MQRGAFSLSAEYVIYGTNGPADADHDGAQQNVFRCIGVPGTEKQHIAEKPVPVMRWMLSVSRGLVLDPFMGSGTILRAAKDLGRRSIGIDVDERYCEIAAKRLRQEILGL